MIALLPWIISYERKPLLSYDTGATSDFIIKMKPLLFYNDQSDFRLTHRERDGSRLFCELARPRRDGFRNVIQKGLRFEGTYVDSTLKSNIFGDRPAPLIRCAQEWTMTTVNIDDWMWKCDSHRRRFAVLILRILCSTSSEFSVLCGCVRPTALL